MKIKILNENVYILVFNGACVTVCTCVPSDVLSLLINLKWPSMLEWTHESSDVEYELWQSFGWREFFHQLPYKDCVHLTCTFIRSHTITVPSPAGALTSSQISSRPQMGWQYKIIFWTSINDCRIQSETLVYNCKQTEAPGGFWSVTMYCLSTCSHLLALQKQTASCP